jgi:hypothetical protein
MKRTHKKRIQYHFVEEIEINQKKEPVAITVYEIHDGTSRFRVSINEGPIHVFGLNNDQTHYVEIDGSRIDPLSEHAKRAINLLLQRKIAA